MFNTDTAPQQSNRTDFSPAPASRKEIVTDADLERAYDWASEFIKELHSTFKGVI